MRGSLASQGLGATGPPVLVAPTGAADEPDGAESWGSRAGLAEKGSEGVNEGDGNEE